MQKKLIYGFLRELPIFTNWKGETYDSIFVIINQLKKMLHYELIKVTINASSLEKVIINVVVKHHGLPNSIVRNWGFVFTSKFWSLLCYFFDIKQKVSYKKDVNPCSKSKTANELTTELQTLMSVYG